jgi:hypothetical protein
MPKGGFVLKAMAGGAIDYNEWYLVNGQKVTSSVVTKLRVILGSS